jgi:hypothetical protein
MRPRNGAEVRRAGFVGLVAWEKIAVVEGMGQVFHRIPQLAPAPDHL